MAREELSRRYRAGVAQRMATPEERLSSVATRLPATVAVLERVLAQIPTENKTLLDLGAGPGTVFWALSAIRSITHLEVDPELIKFGKKLQPPGAPVVWLEGDFNKTSFEFHDIALFSYSFNESVNLPLLTKAWESAQTVVMVEPGTPRGYQHILLARDHLIKLGAHIIAPCPHANPCPLSAPDWCHFAVRVPRLKWHRELKEGTLGYEDEKYSYLIASKNAAPSPFARLLTAPEKHSGHLSLRLCTPSGIRQQILSKKEGPLYKKARKLESGEALVIDK